MNTDFQDLLAEMCPDIDDFREEPTPEEIEERRIETVIDNLEAEIMYDEWLAERAEIQGKADLWEKELTA